ncbi:hypothetical protein FOCG_04558 [Fusarium oxysporum f. sp. radicis-lycopersici 26381]|nr:hypothetical protein FOCG_04558 [Fusarium oxysporum f. sp. radicis-lycopersici 26381]
MLLAVAIRTYSDQTTHCGSAVDVSSVLQGSAIE